MRKGLIAVAALLTLTGCQMSPQQRAELTHDVEAYGFEDVTIGDWEPYSCSKDDVYEYGFTATNVRGQHVSGVICKGWLKGATVRIK